MLDLASVEVSGFRSLAGDVALALDPAMTVLTGENDGGKTATLHAVEALLGERMLDEDDVCRSNDGPVCIKGYFIESDDGSEVCVRAYREKDGAPIREVRRSCHKAFGADPSAHTVADLKALMIAANITMPASQLKADLVAAVLNWLEAQPDSEFTDEWVSLDRDTAARLPALTSYKASTTADPENHVRAVVTQEVRRLLEDAQFAERLAAVESDLAKAVDPELDALKAKIKAYCPDLDGVEVEANYDFAQPRIVVRLLLKRNGEDHPLSKSGEGKKRRITLAIHEAGLESLQGGERVRSEVITYDEPDTNLDYGSQRALFGILEEQAKLEHVQVIVATHSLNFIDKVPLRSIAHFQLDEDQHSKIEVLSSDAFGDEVEFFGSVCVGLGLRNSVLLDERAFMMLEGETEFAAMPALFRTVTDQSLVSSGVTMFNSQGSGALRKIATAMKTEWKRQVVVLLDEDQRAVPATVTWINEMGLIEDVDLFYVGTKELEDGFADATWAAVLNAGYLKHDGSPWIDADVAALRTSDKFSRDLVALVRKECGTHLITKPDLGLALGQHLHDATLLPASLVSCIDAALKAGQ